MPPVLTLTTDFGLKDPYVGQLKGAVLKGCRAATIVDITHGIAPWDVIGAAMTIESSYGFFPAGTVHLVVVDPGVGSRRAILAAEAKGHFFLAPDNGVLSFVLNAPSQRIHRLDRHWLELPAATPTFHGRDIMAPAACQLLQGTPLEALGPSVDWASLIRLPAPAEHVGEEVVQTRVQHIDRFGNIRLPLRVDHTGSFGLVTVTIKDILIKGLYRSYHEVPVGSLLVLVDSAGYLEIAANQAHAAQLIDCSIGDPVTIVFHSS